MMNRRSRKARQRRTPSPTWTTDRALAAVPYLRTVVSSLREHAIEKRAWEERVRRLNGKPGRADRGRLLEVQEAEQQAVKARQRFQEATVELEGLDVYCIDALEGQALLPFIHENQLAWYLFDLFAARPLNSWRLHSDPDETRRPLSQLQAQPSPNRPAA
jgi:hypothetical protein